MVKHILATHAQNLRTNCLSVFGHFVGLALNGLMSVMELQLSQEQLL